MTISASPQPPSDIELAQLAANPDTPPERLWELAQLSDELAELVAANPNFQEHHCLTDPKFRFIWGSKNRLVACMVARTDTPAWLIQSIPQLYAADCSSEYRKALVRCPGLTPELIHDILSIIEREQAENEEKYKTRTREEGQSGYFQSRSYQLTSAFLGENKRDLLKHPNYQPLAPGS